MQAIEFLPWYQPEGQMVRCSECAALVISADAETHVKWHIEQETLQVGTIEGLRQLVATLTEEKRKEIEHYAADLPRQAG